MFKLVASFVLIVMVVALGASQAYRLGGAYPLLAHDHADVMVSKTASSPTRTLSVLFVGNSLTFVNDLPAMLVNIASSDRANTTRLEVKAKTYPDASLEFLLTQTDALAYAQAHRPNYVVLQEHGAWYDQIRDVDSSGVANWTPEILALGGAPVLFEVMADGDGSTAYTDNRYATFGHTPDEEAAKAIAATGDLGRELALPVVKVGEAFERARWTKGAPDVYGPDHHHPSVAGTYLAALVFYQYFTGRTGSEATYQPLGMSRSDAARLVAISAG